MITELKSIAEQIANSRVRLSSIDDYQVSQELKSLEGLEANLRNIIFELEEKIKDILD